MKKLLFIASVGLLFSCTEASVEALSENEAAIGSQVWMTQNLNVDKFRNGDPIPEAKTNAEWETARNNKQPAWCYYDNNPANGVKYGKLYNYYAVNDSRGLAPAGYHIPSNEEWTKLTDFLGGEGVAGIKMKSTNGWYKDGNGTNESGFSGLPGGYRGRGGAFMNRRFTGYWWTATVSKINPGVPHNLKWGDGRIRNNDDVSFIGMSVRCIKD
jgi:uncharacterized protein (TIGR02145 family)